MKMTGAQIIVNCLLECGVDTVFGYPGGQVIHLYNALYGSPLKHILPVHEQGAIHAADGYARASGKAGVCIATSGPGAANIVTGLATAYMDSVPVVAIAGQVSTGHIGRDAFQEIDIVSVTLAMTKHSFQVTDARKLSQTIRQAFQIALSGRPGPVLIEIPADIQQAVIDYTPGEEAAVNGFAAEKNLESTDEILSAISEAARLIREARRPVIVAGGGIIRAEASEKARAFADYAGIPVVSTLMGLGALPAAHSQFLGLTGMHGHVPANNAVAGADLILAIGSRFSERITGDRKMYAAGKTIIQIDIDPAEVDKNITAHIPLIGPMPQLLDQLREKLQPGDYSPWWTEIRRWQKEYKEERLQREGEDSPAAILSAPWIMREISRQMEGGSPIYVTDVGQNQLWAAQHLDINEPRSWLTSGGCGTMGFGLPAAIGAQLAVPSSRVVHIAGDGGFKMTAMELYMAVGQQLPIISVILDNHSLGMVKQWQHLFFQSRYSATQLPDFDFVAFAAAFGVKALAVKNREEFARAFQEARDSKTAFVIIAEIPADDLVLPMVAPGAALDDFVKVDA